MQNMALEYDAEARTVYVSYLPPQPGRQYFLETVQEVEDHGKQFYQFWQEHCGGQPVYWLVNFDNFSINPKADTPEHHLRLMRELMDTTGVVVRFGGSILARSLARWLDAALERPLHLYDTREQAEAALSHLRGSDAFSHLAAGDRGVQPRL